MMRNTIRGVLAALGVGLLLVASPPRAEDMTPEKLCETPFDMIADGSPLRHAARQIRAENRLKIVALGSSSTMGMGASGPDAAYPSRLETALADLFPKLDIQVINKGVARQTAEQMLARLQKDVIAEKPGIVIWETGGGEAARGADVEQFAATLLQGIDHLWAADIDVVLMDAQYSPNTAQLINFNPYLVAIDQVAGMRDLILFPRYSVMHYWVDNDRFNFTARSSVERRRVADKVYDCVARQTARSIEQGLKLAR